MNDNNVMNDNNDMNYNNYNNVPAISFANKKKSTHLFRWMPFSLFLSYYYFSM